MEDSIMTAHLVIITESFSIFTVSDHVSGADLHTINIVRGFEADGWKVILISVLQGKSEWQMRECAGKTVSGFTIEMPVPMKDVSENISRTLAPFFKDANVLLRQFTPQSLAMLRKAKQFGAQRIILQIVDAGLLCVRSKLVKATGVRCQGPVSHEDCTRCSFSHRKPVLNKIAGLAFEINKRSGGIFRPLASRIRTINERVSQCFRWQDVVKNCDALAFQSAALRDAFLANGLPLEKVRMTITGAEETSPIPLSSRPALSGPLLVGYAGQIEFDKGFDRVFLAVEKLRTHVGDKVKLIVGSKRSASGYNREWYDRISSCAWVEVKPYDGKVRADVDSWHSSIHLLCVPSRWIDNRPNVALEAIARGTPVVCPDVGCFREMVCEGQTGFTFQAGEPENLFRLLLTITRNSSILENLYERTVNAEPLPSIQDEVISLKSAFSVDG